MSAAVVSFPKEVVVVGASLGGLVAVRRLLQPLPAKFPLPLVLVQHRRPDADSHLPRLLSNECALKVLEPEDKEKLLPGHVYVAPANYHVLLERGSLWLSVDAPVLFARPSIDVLFESAADAYGSGAVAVLLTGSNEDGAAGARAVKRAGGTVLVQDPETAESPIAPRAAMALTPVDGVLSVPAIAARLIELARV